MRRGIGEAIAVTAALTLTGAACSTDQEPKAIDTTTATTGSSIATEELGSATTLVVSSTTAAPESTATTLLVETTMSTAVPTSEAVPVSSSSTSLVPSLGACVRDIVQGEDLLGIAVNIEATVEAQLGQPFAVEELIGGLMVRNNIENSNLIYAGDDIDLCVTLADIQAGPNVVLQNTVTSTTTP